MGGTGKYAWPWAWLRGFRVVVERVESVLAAEELDVAVGEGDVAARLAGVALAGRLVPLGDGAVILARVVRVRERGGGVVLPVVDRPLRLIHVHDLFRSAFDLSDLQE